MKEIVKKLLKSNCVGRLIYEPIHSFYRMYSVPHRRKMLQKYGPQVLAKLAAVFKKHDIPGFLAAGSLLGFVRDGGFMQHDDDVDIGILPSSWRPNRLLKLLVEEEGFKFEFAFSLLGHTTEFKVSWLGVPIDFFCYEREGDDMYCTCFYYFPNRDYPAPNANTAWRIHEHNTVQLGTMRMCGVDFPIPSEPEKVMARLYGEDWRVPNPNWDDSMHPGREEIKDLGYSITYEEAIKA